MSPSDKTSSASDSFSIDISSSSYPLAEADEKVFLKVEDSLDPLTDVSDLEENVGENSILLLNSKSETSTDSEDLSLSSGSLSEEISSTEETESFPPEKRLIVMKEDKDGNTTINSEVGGSQVGLAIPETDSKPPISDLEIDLHELGDSEILLLETFGESSTLSAYDSIRNVTEDRPTTPILSPRNSIPTLVLPRGFSCGFPVTDDVVVDSAAEQPYLLPTEPPEDPLAGVDDLEEYCRRAYTPTIAVQGDDDLASEEEIFERSFEEDDITSPDDNILIECESTVICVTENPGNAFLASPEPAVSLQSDALAGNQVSCSSANVTDIEEVAGEEVVGPEPVVSTSKLGSDETLEEEVPITSMSECTLVRAEQSFNASMGEGKCSLNDKSNGQSQKEPCHTLRSKSHTDLERVGLTEEQSKELAAQDVVAAPVPATQQTTADPADECKFSANDLIYLEKLMLTSETQQGQSGQVQVGIGNGDLIKDTELLPCSLVRMDSDIEISPTTETVENDGPRKIGIVGNDGLCRIEMRGNEPEVSHAIEYARNDTEASQPNERMTSDIEIPRRSESTANDIETPCLPEMVGSDFDVSCASENVDNLPEVPLTIDNEGKVSKTPFTFDNEGDIPKIPFTTDTEGSLSSDPCTIDNEGKLPGASYTTDIENMSEILLTGVDEIHLSEVPFTSDNQGSLREAPFIIDNKGNLSEARFVIDNLPEGSFTIEGDLSDVPFVFDYNGNQPTAPFTIDNEGNLHEAPFTVVNEGNLQGVPFSFDNEAKLVEAPFILNNKGGDISEALILDDDNNLSHFTEQELLVHDNDMISEATQQPHENLSSGKPFQEREPWYQDFEPDDEMRDLTQRVADVASSLASTLEKLEHDSPSEREPMERPSVPHKKEKHVRISEEDEIIYPSRGSYECDIGDEERRRVLQSFEASVEQMLLDVESEAATLPKLDQHAPLADFEQEPIIEFESYDVELPHTPELSEDEYLEHVHFPPKSLTESYSPIPCGDIIARSRSPSSPRPTSVNSESDEARPIKAEIKLLVTTREEGKEAVEIRSIREFVDAEEKSKSTFSRIVARSPTPGSEEGRTSRGADMEPRIYEQQETSGSPVESHQHTTPEGATVHTTQYTTPDGTTVRTTHTRVVSEGVSGDSDAIQQQMQEMMADVMQQQQQEH